MTETFVAALARHARERPGALALADDRVRLTWAEIADWVERAAGFMAGLPRGTPVLGWLPNAAEWYLLRLASERAGVLWVPVSSALGLRELTAIVARIRPALIVSPTRFRGRDYAAESEAACREAGLTARRITVPDRALLALDGPTPPADRPLQADEAAHVLTTTGSEGVPKLSLYSLSAAMERGWAQARLLRMTAGDGVVALSAGTGPGKTSWLAAPLAGAAVVAIPVFSAGPALEAIGRGRATIVCGTPAQLAMLLPEMSRFDMATVRVWYTAGAVLPAALAEELESRTRGIVLSVYGATDFGGWAAPDLDDPPAVRRGTVGRPRGGTEFRIVDGEGRDVAPGEVGEILGRGPCSVAGYYGDPELTRSRWREGWFRTGDVGRFDEAGNLVIVGRARDLIIRGGENIAPEEIEILLRAHPDVLQAAVVGVPDPVLGERVCACIVPAPGARPTLDALRDHLRRERIAHYKLPERLVILSAMPLVGDKIDRATLVTQALGNPVPDAR